MPEEDDVGRLASPLIEGSIWSVTLSSLELYFLAGLLRVTNLLGVEDPFPLQSPTDEDLERARQALVQSGLLTVLRDGSEAPEVPLAAAVRANSLARRTLLASRTDPDGAENLRLFHRMPDEMVEQETLPDGQLRLTTLRASALSTRLQEFLKLPETPAAPGAEIILAESALTEARRLAGAGEAEACLEHLSGVGVLADAGAALAATSAEGGHAGSVVTLLRDDRTVRYGESLAWLVGSRGAWGVQALERRGVPTVRLIPTDTASIGRRLRAIVLALASDGVPFSGGNRDTGYE